jgi:hypothetical protein
MFYTFINVLLSYSRNLTLEEVTGQSIGHRLKDTHHQLPSLYKRLLLL